MIDPALTPEVLRGLLFSLLCGFAVALLAAFMFRKRRQAERRAADPQIILRRCRLALWEVRQELSMLPATREMHTIFAEIENCNHTIDLVEAAYKER